MKVRKPFGRTAPTEPENGPTSNPDADELAALRKEKADREAAAQAEKEKELEDLRAFKAEQEKKATVKAPVKKTEKTETVTETAPTTTPPPAKKRRRLWWDDDE